MVIRAVLDECVESQHQSSFVTTPPLTHSERQVNMNDRLAALETHFSQRASARPGGAQQALVDAQNASYGTESPVAKLASLQSRMQEDAAALPATAEPEPKEAVSMMNLQTKTGNVCVCFPHLARITLESHHHIPNQDFTYDKGFYEQGSR